LVATGGAPSFTTVTTGLGNASAPSITFTGDTNTGIFSPTADTIAFTEGGTESMRITSAGDVGIGTTSPTGKLEVTGGQLRVTASSASSMFLVNPSTTYADGVDIQATYNGAGSFGPLKFTTSGTERGRFDTSGNFLFNSGYGSVATAYGCRAWANWNGSSASPITPRASGNIGSITKSSTGEFTVNFTTAMPDTNYSVVGTGQRANTNLVIVSIKGSASYNSINTGSVNIRTTDEAGNLVDALAVCVAVFR
jgi:hypothetical protein